MATTDTLIDPQAQALLNCLDEALADHPYKPLIVSMRAGERAVIGITQEGLDECKCGYAWVRVASVFPTTSADFPGVSSDDQPQCGLTWGMRFEMGIKRCAPDTTHAVTPDMWQDIHLKTMIDLASMRQAICCWIGRQSPPEVGPVPYKYSIGEFTPSGPEGLCLGWTVEISTMMESCDGC